MVTVDLAKESASERLGLIWIRCSWPVVTVGLMQILKEVARVHCNRKPPEDTPAFVIICMDSVAEDLSEIMDRLHESHPDTVVLVFGLRLDLALALAALQNGARGFVHAGMQPKQIVRALHVASEGELVAPRQLLQFLVSGENSSISLTILSARQREILELVAGGSSNAQIAKQLYLSESTIKQHLRAAYKLLGVKNRTEAARLYREAG